MPPLSKKICPDKIQGSAHALRRCCTDQSLLAHLRHRSMIRDFQGRGKCRQGGSDRRDSLDLFNEPGRNTPEWRAETLSEADDGYVTLREGVVHFLRSETRSPRPTDIQSPDQATCSSQKITMWLTHVCIRKSLTFRPVEHYQLQEISECFRVDTFEKMKTFTLGTRREVIL
jgi:hypothetical protein